MSDSDRLHMHEYQRLGSGCFILKDISVVVSTFSRERADCLVSCFESLRRQTMPPREVLLVLDNDEKLVSFYKELLHENVKIVVSEGFGLSAARNMGVKNSRSEFVAFIDDDAVADKDWLETMIKNYDDLDVVGVGGIIKPLWEGTRPFWFPEELDWIVGCSYKGLPEHRSTVRNPIGCNMSFRRTVFEKVGYFATRVGRTGRRLTAGEEAELSMRIRDRVPYSKMIYDPQAIVYHRVPRNRTTLKYVIKRSFYEGFSKALISRARSKQTGLSTEQTYLKYTLMVAIPARLKLRSLFRNLCGIFVMSAATFSVFAGYLTGSFS